MPALVQRSTPLAPIRAVHLDLKGLPPTPERLLGLLPIIKLAHCNAVLMEWEDTFPWTIDERFRGETCYSPELVRDFCARADELGIAVIPLVQCLGHMETPLQVEDYAHLRELPDRTDCLNPLAPGARKLVADMIDDVLALQPQPRHFHLGGDEAWRLGEHPDTRAYIEEHGKAALYLQHVGPLLEQLNAKGIRPILWHDMMKDWPEDALRQLAEHADLMVWGYRGTPETTTHHYNREVIARMAAAEVPLWGAGAFKCGADAGSHLPCPADREENMLGWARAAEEFGMVGLCATGWSRNCTPLPQYAPIDACLDVLIQCGVIMHDGEPAAGGLEACVAALDEIGEGAAFRPRREALQRFVAACDDAWHNIRYMRRILSHLATDPTRPEGGMVQQMWDHLQQGRDRVLADAKTVKTHFLGLTPEVWLDRLLGAATLAVETEVDALASDVREAQART